MISISREYDLHENRSYCISTENMIYLETEYDFLECFVIQRKDVHLQTDFIQKL